MLSRLGSVVNGVRWTRFISFEWLAKINLPSLDLQDYIDDVVTAPTLPLSSVRRRTRDHKAVVMGRL